MRPWLLRNGPLADMPQWLIKASLKPEPPPQPSSPSPPPNSGDGSPYGLEALSEECTAVQHAPFGQQELMLNNGALKIGSLVAAGELLESYALSELIAAGNAMPSESGREPWRAAEIEKKVRRAFEDGKRTPRQVPPPRANISRISVNTRAKARPSEEAPPGCEAQDSPHDRDEAQAVNGTGDAAESNLPAIIVRSGERHLAADAGLSAIAAAGIQFYRRDRALVRVCRIKAKRADGGEVFVPAVTVITMPMLSRALGQSARWWKYNRKREPAGIDPPETIAEQILGMIDDWPFPPLRGVIATQTMRHDGTLLIAPGYDTHPADLAARG
jgi:hypothetical protein